MYLLLKNVKRSTKNMPTTKKGKGKARMMFSGVQVEQKWCRSCNSILN